MASAGVTAVVATTLGDNIGPTAAKPGTLLGVGAEREAACRGPSSGTA